MVLSQKDFFAVAAGVLMVRLFTNGPEDWGSIQAQLIPNTKKKKKKKKWYFMPPSSPLTIKSKSSNPGKGVAPYTFVLLKF